MSEKQIVREDIPYQEIPTYGTGLDRMCSSETERMKVDIQKLLVKYPEYSEEEICDLVDRKEADTQKNIEYLRNAVEIVVNQMPFFKYEDEEDFIEQVGKYVEECFEGRKLVDEETLEEAFEDFTTTKDAEEYVDGELEGLRDELYEEFNKLKESVPTEIRESLIDEMKDGIVDDAMDKKMDARLGTIADLRIRGFFGRLWWLLTGK